MTTLTVPTSAPTPIQMTREIQFDKNGRLVGVDGVLDQVSAALGRQAEPILRNTILPTLRADRELQRTVGAAAGKALARELKPFFFVITGAVLFIAWNSYRSNRVRANRSRLR